MNIDMLQQLLEMLGLAGQQDQQDPRVPPWNRNAPDRPDFWRGGYQVAPDRPMPRPAMKALDHLLGGSGPMLSNGDRLRQLAGR